ncbi:MAG: NAD-dependent epimerase/dehydratase family protein [Ignavibacteriales bacterium]|nr:NAD-dependent epimerase/dehydratase family protein [Ignavibacteriales bacterium]
MKTLLTGATGFVGSHLGEALSRCGDQLRCLVRNRRKALEQIRYKAEVIETDFSSLEELVEVLDGVDRVFHVAGTTRAIVTKDYYTGNVDVTERLVEACRLSDVSFKRFVYVSSLAAMGPSDGSVPIREDCPYHPVSHYGRSKMLGERAVLKARSWLPVTIVRPSAVYGPREHDMAEYVRCVRRGLIPLVGYAPKYLNLVHVNDLVDGILAAATQNRAVDQTYFIGSEENYSTRHIGEVVADAAGRHSCPLRVPQAVVFGIAAAGEAFGRLSRRPVFFNLEKAKESVHSWACSVEKAREQLAYGQRVSLAEGMRVICAIQEEEERRSARNHNLWKLHAADRKLS